MSEDLESIAAQVKATEPGPEIDGILVHVEYTDDGSTKLEIQCLGTTRVTEIETLLKSALKLHVDRLGL